MSESQAGRQSLDDLLIVDADVHVHESPAELAPYCDMPWRKSLEGMSEIRENYLDIPGFSPGTVAYGPTFPTGHESHRTVLTPGQMRSELSKIHVDIGILFPDHLLKIAVLSHADYAAALARAYNSWLVERWASPEHGLLGCLVACPQDPDDAATEIRRYAKHPGIVGVYLPCAGVDPLWGHRKYDPIYRAAEESDLPVLLHSVTVLHPVYPFNIQVFDTNFARHSVSHSIAIMVNLVHMMTTGVPVRFPALRIAVCETGVFWIPFLMQRLDKEYVENRREVPFLTDRPSRYMKKFFYATQPIEEPEELKDVATMVSLFDGEDQTIFASDWPHHDFDHPSKLYQVPFSNEVRRKIFGENALRLFKIDAHARRTNI
jgi:predicted TIM-barrel fold metal-dependent hydrolase